MRVFAAIGWAFKAYLSVGLIYGLYSAVVAGWRLCGIFGSDCPDYDYTSTTVAFVTAFIPDVTLYMVAIFLARGLLWFPLLVSEIAIFGLDGLLNWLLLRNLGDPLHIFMAFNRLP